jgi:hypothetical protein
VRLSSARLSLEQATTSEVSADLSSAAGAVIASGTGRRQVNLVGILQELGDLGRGTAAP